MRFGFFNSYTLWGGGEKWHFTAAEYMANMGHEVFVLCHPDGELFQRINAHPKMTAIEIIITKHSYWNPFFQLELHLKLRSLNLDTLVFNAPRDVRSAALTSRFAGIPRVIYRNGMPFPIPQKRSMIWAFQKGLTQIVCISKENRRVLEKESPLLAKGHNIEIVTNAFDFTKVPEAKTDQDDPKEMTTLSNTGRLSEPKGQYLLFQSCYLLKKTGYKIKLLMAGDGELEEELKSLAASLDLKEEIEFLGFQKDIYETLYRSDIFAFTSIWEGTASSILEAQAIALPVVCFDISSMPEMVAHEETGLLAKAKDAEDFAFQLERLINSPDLRKSLGEAGRKNVKERFNVEDIYARWEAILTN
jgi:glycosyltransferase involved in cell wall biosynthesis